MTYLPPEIAAARTVLARRDERLQAERQALQTTRQLWRLLMFGNCLLAPFGWLSLFLVLANAYQMRGEFVALNLLPVVILVFGVVTVRWLKTERGVTFESMLDELAAENILQRYEAKVSLPEVDYPEVQQLFAQLILRLGKILPDDDLAACTVMRHELRIYGSLLGEVRSHLALAVPDQKSTLYRRILQVIYDKLLAMEAEMSDADDDEDTASGETIVP